MATVADIFSALGGPAAVARALNVRNSTASEMKRRGSIPVEYWRDLILAARRRGVLGVTAEALVAVHARKAGEDEPSSPALAMSVPDGPAQKPDGHFSRWYHVRRPHFATSREITEHLDALRDEWAGR